MNTSAELTDDTTSALVNMNPDRLIVEAIKVAQDLLRKNLPPMHNLTDAVTVREFRNAPSPAC